MLSADCRGAYENYVALHKARRAPRSKNADSFLEKHLAAGK